MIINVIEYLAQTEKQYSNKAAVRDGISSISFNELKSFSEQLSGAIEKVISGEKKKPIAVLLPKSASTISVFMAILNSGNIYVPLDVKMPQMRLEKILENLQPALIIYDDITAPLLEKLKYFYLCRTKEDLCKEPCNWYDLGELCNEIIDADPAYIIYTSGSTGVPKGVVVSHRGIIDYIEWAVSCYDIASEEIIGNQAPLFFDNSTLDIYLCMKTGATLEIIPEEQFAFPIRLMQYVEEKGITFIFWVPSVLINVMKLKALDSLDIKCLRKILFAGEVMPNKQLNYWRQNIPHALYSNLYGPTEITVDCTYYIVDRQFLDNEPLPIGFPCRNSNIIILNENDKACMVGEVGELCVVGSSLALGYWNEQDKTEAVFCQNPLNTRYIESMYRTGDLVYMNSLGEIMYVGRKDNQIKHLGYRIELGEIESAIMSIEGVQNCCVIYDKENTQLVAFVEIETDVVDNQAIRRELMLKVPKYMVPAKYVKIEEMPLNKNGKIDRHKLGQSFNG